MQSTLSAISQQNISKLLEKFSLRRAVHIKHLYISSMLANLDMEMFFVEDKFVGLNIASE